MPSRAQGKISQADKNAALIRAAMMGDAAVVKALLAAGADVNAKDPVFEQTALMWAASDGNARVVRLLLNAGADAQATNVDGKTAQDMAWGRARDALANQSGPIPEASAARQSRSSMQDELAAISRKLEALEAAQAKPAPPQIHSDVDAPGYQFAQDPRKFALVVGIENYKSLPSARFALRDAQAMRRFLLASGYPPSHIAYLTGDDASRAAIAAYVESWLPRNSGRNSEIFVYFAGHGAPDIRSGEAYLVPWDGDPDYLSQTGYALNSLYAALSRLKARRIIVALDSCFSGAGGRSVLPQGARPLVTRVDGLAPGSHALAVMSAAASNEIAGVDSGQGHGLFTYYLLKGLKTFQGQIGLPDLYDYLKPHVERQARLDNRSQIPQFLPVQALSRDKRWRL